MIRSGNLSSIYQLRKDQLERLRAVFKEGRLDNEHFAAGLRYLGFSESAIEAEIEEQGR